MAAGTELVGRWFTIDGDGGIVRYVGPVAGSSGEWLGVEWATGGRGRHDGSRGGRRYFECRFPQNAGEGAAGASFIRAVARIDWGQPLLRAVRDRYSADGPAALAQLAGGIDGRRGRIEAVGLEQVAEAQARLPSLAVVGAESRRVWGCDGPLDELRGARTLLLAGNFLTAWAQVEGILNALPQRRLDLLDVSDNHLESMQCGDSRTAVDTLRLDASPMVGWAGAQAVAAACAVRALSLGWCALGDPGDAELVGWRRLRELRVAGNELTSILPFGRLPCLQLLDASGNRRLRAVPPLPAGAFPQLRSLDLSRTAIAEWSSIDALCAIPSLRALATAHACVADADPHPRSQLVARLPHVATIDRSDVTTVERTELERHYLSLCATAVGAAGDALVPAMAARFPRIAELVAAHGAPRVAPVDSRLKARLAETAIEIARGIGAEDRPLAVHARPLLRSMLVRQLRALAARLAGRRGPLALYLRAGAGADWAPLDNDARPLSFYGLDAGCTVRAVPGDQS